MWPLAEVEAFARECLLSGSGGPAAPCAIGARLFEPLRDEAALPLWVGDREFLDRLVRGRAREAARRIPRQCRRPRIVFMGGMFRNWRIGRPCGGNLRPCGEKIFSPYEPDVGGVLTMLERRLYLGGLPWLRWPN